MYGIATNMSSMMALGLFVFTLDTVPYQQLQRSVAWRHPASSRVGKRPARQFAGQGDETITLSGVLYPELTGGTLSLATLEALAKTGKAWPLLEGTGRFYGMFVVEDISETRSYFFADGAARKIEFTIKLTRVDDDDINLLGAAQDALAAIL